MSKGATFNFGKGIYKDTGCELSPKCLTCLIESDRCPENKVPRQQARQGELSLKAIRQLEALRIAAGGDICDEGSPMNIRWKKYWGNEVESIEL